MKFIENSECQLQGKIDDLSGMLPVTSGRCRGS